MDKGLVFLESIIKHIEYYKDKYYDDIYTYSYYYEISEKEKFNTIRKELEHKKELERENQILINGFYGLKFALEKGYTDGWHQDAIDTANKMLEGKRG